MLIGQCISYPKSGRSWLRRMLEVAGYARQIEFHHDGFEFNDGTRPAHNFNVALRLERYSPSAKIIYLERDPRDVIVSLYHQVTGRFHDFYEYDGKISDFIRDPYFGAEVLARFRDMWATIINARPIMVIRYEDMHRDTLCQLDRVITYLGLDVTTDSVTNAVEAGRFEAMRELERSGAHHEPWLRLRNGFAKVRRGEAGAFGIELDADDIGYLNSVFGFADKRFKS